MARCGLHEDAFDQVSLESHALRTVTTSNAYLPCRQCVLIIYSLCSRSILRYKYMLKLSSIFICPILGGVYLLTYYHTARDEIYSFRI